MLPGGTDPFYRRLLAAGHQPYGRVEVWRNNRRLAILERDTGQEDGGLVFLAGTTLTATLTSQVSRRFNLVVPDYLYPDDPSDLLAPYGNEIRAFAGVKLGDGALTYTWQVFRGKISDPQASSDSAVCTIPCDDRAQEVLDNTFVTPQNSQTSNSISAEYQRLIIDAVPDATFGVSDTFAQAAPPLAWDFERGSAIEEMLSSAGALWYPLADGSFVTRRYPWAVPGNPVITVTDGDLLFKWTKRRSRSGVYNVITVTGERLNGDTPVTATVSDTNPASPTFIDGGFGIRSQPVRRQTPATPGGAQAAAEARLRTTIALTEEWTWETPVDAALELGDVVRLDTGDRQVIQVVQSFTLPFDGVSPMQVQGRSQVIGQVEAGV